MPWFAFTPAKTRDDEYWFQCFNPASPAFSLTINPNKNQIEIIFNDNQAGKDAIAQLGGLLTIKQADKRRYILHNYTEHVSICTPLIVGVENSPEQLLELIMATIPPASSWRRPKCDAPKHRMTVKFDEQSIVETKGLTAKIRQLNGGLGRSSPLKNVYTFSDEEEDEGATPEEGQTPSTESVAKVFSKMQ